MKTFLTLLGILFLASVVSAQNLSPVVVEGHGPQFKGTFRVDNLSIAPLAVFLDAQSFTDDVNGKPTYRPLDPGIHIAYHEKTAHIGAKQSHLFDYTVTCDKMPCWFTIYSSTVIGHTNEGIQVKIMLPHTAYVCDKNEKHCRDFVRQSIFGMKG